eukprot:RCo012827
MADDSSKSAKVLLTSKPGEAFDEVLYGTASKEKFLASIPANDEEDAEDELPVGGGGDTQMKKLLTSYSAPKSVYDDLLKGSENAADPFAAAKPAKITDREDEYRRRRLQMVMSPSRVDNFAVALSEKTPAPGEGRTYAQILMERQLDQEKKDVERQLAQQQEESKKAAAAAADEAKRKAAEDKLRKREEIGRE